MLKPFLCRNVEAVDSLLTVAVVVDTCVSRFGIFRGDRQVAGHFLGSGGEPRVGGKSCLPCPARTRVSGESFDIITTRIVESLSTRTGDDGDAGRALPCDHILDSLHQISPNPKAIKLKLQLGGST